jgi:hypothetical protein
MKKVAKEKFTSKPFDSDNSYSFEEENNQMNEIIETTEKTKALNQLKRRFCFYQSELLNFVNNFEFFVGYSVKCEEFL